MMSQPKVKLLNGFHKDKTLHSPYTYWVNSTKVEIYFSPWDRNREKKLISERIVEVLKSQAQHDVKFSAFSITPGIAVSTALWELPDSKKVTLNGVISNDFYSRYRKANAIWASEESRKGLRMISESNELRKLHHKTIFLLEKEMYLCKHYLLISKVLAHLGNGHKNELR